MKWYCLWKGNARVNELVFVKLSTWNFAFQFFYCNFAYFARTLQQNAASRKFISHRSSHEIFSYTIKIWLSFIDPAIVTNWGFHKRTKNWQSWYLCQICYPFIHSSFVTNYIVNCPKRLYQYQNFLLDVTIAITDTAEQWTENESWAEQFFLRIHCTIYQNGNMSFFVRKARK